MRLRVLASGSRGNCLAVRSAGGTLVMVDCGLSCRETCRRANDCGFCADSAAAILFTHDHADHISGLSTFRKRNPSISLFANGDTAEAIAARTGVDGDWTVFDSDTPFSIADLRITPFALSHDAADPVGYLIEDTAPREATLFSPNADPAALFIATDTGIPTEPMRRAFLRADCAILESNYDPTLLETSDRSWTLKRRISGRSGHLSNLDAADFFRSANPSRLRTLLLAHISQECNAPDIALATMRSAIADCSRTDISLAALSQDTPSDLFLVNP